MKLPSMLKINKTSEKYWTVFLITFGIMMVIMLPTMIFNKGIFLYYGDFNSQQLPFYTHAHEMIRSGNIFWDWGTDLGSNFIGSYSFYLLGSPFFWLTLPFPTKAVVYLVPWLLAIKTGVAGVTSYAFARRFVKSKNACIIAGILYALSGFQLYNIFFNHFHDVVAFFPLLLIALEERVQNEKRGVFALAVGLCAMVNYFFFTGQVTFLIIYFLCRCMSDDFKITLKKFIGLAIESILGVMLSCFMLLPSVLAIAENPRVDNVLLGHDMIVYSDKFRIWRIIQSFFMLPDPPARSNLFSSNTARWASIAGYLPLFSMAGVIAFFKQKKKHWMKSVITVCIIFAFIPILNTSFYAFNSSYYARWFYMPILLMAVMTAYVLDNKEMSIKKGVPICVGAGMFFTIAGLLPTKNKNVPELTDYGKLPNYPDLFWISTIITFIGLILLVFLAYKVKKNKLCINKAKVMTAFCAVVCCAGIVWYGVAQGPWPENYINEAINGKQNITLNDDSFYRVDMSETHDNYPMFWGESSMRTFHSVVPSSIMEFYTEIDITRDVASRVPTNRFALRGLLSAKYYFNHTSSKELSMIGFEKIGTQNNFDVYENKYYIPMGFTYDYYTTDEQFKNAPNGSKDKLLMKSLVLDYFQYTRYQNVLQPYPGDTTSQVYDEYEYSQDCKERRESSAHYFENDTKGFTAKINMAKENLVFFSVPYEKGWTATVNGKEARVEKVSNGFMAVLAPKGENVEIRFNYMTPGLIPGICMTIFAAALLIVYVKIANKKYGSKAVAIDYGYDSVEDIQEETEESISIEGKEKPIDETSIGSEEQ